MRTITQSAGPNSKLFATILNILSLSLFVLLPPHPSFFSSPSVFSASSPSTFPVNDQRRKVEQGIFLFSELPPFILYLATGRYLFVAATSCGRGDCMSLLKGFGVKLIYNIGVTITARDYRQICIAIEIIEIAITQIAVMQIILRMLSL